MSGSTSDAPAGSGPFRSPSASAGRSDDDALRRSILLQRCFDGPEMRWSDALIARMRRHVGGCVSTVEMQMRLEMERLAPTLFAASPLLREPCCWPVVQRQPDLIPAALLDHLRDRAALSLMQQDVLYPAPQGASEGDAGFLPKEMEDLLSMIVLAQARWADAGPDASPLRADLPAERMADLVWTVAAILVETLVSDGDIPSTQAMAFAERAGAAVLANHDEQAMPFATAALMAHRARGASIGDAELLRLARDRHTLPLLALMADRTEIELLTLVRAAIEESEQALFILCRAADFPREVAVRLVLGRRCVARGVDDSMLVEYADSYDGMTVAEARNALIVLRLPEPLRARLSPSRCRIGFDGG